MTRPPNRSGRASEGSGRGRGYRPGGNTRGTRHPGKGAHGKQTRPPSKSNGCAGVVVAVAAALAAVVALLVLAACGPAPLSPGRAPVPHPIPTPAQR